ncbi:MAG: formylglycine-generating enzyme family protein [Burkholderiales bacterium]|nr:formylglycine-generating enzyme family protein [Burkholderiales bacterium]
MKRFPRHALAAWVAALAAALAPAGALAQGGAYVVLPGGTFTSILPQGNTPESSAPVQVPAFAMRVEPVTAGEFLAFVRRHPEWQRGRAPALFADGRYLAGWAGPLELADAAAAQRPVVDVSWFAAQAYCESEGARLPSWIEWEYAAAADATRTDARGDAGWRARILQWYERPSTAQPAAVGGEANAYGVRDLHGLIWEWVDDYNALFIAGDSRTQGDPDRLKFCGAGALSVIDRESYAVLMRIALLSSLNAADTTTNLGFRCVRPAPGVPHESPP